MPLFEIDLEWTGKGKRPTYAEWDYGFYPNPPIQVEAKTKRGAVRKLKLPKTVRVKRIKRVW